MLTTKDKRRLRRAAHHLNSIVTIVERGITPGLLDETRRALRDHELIKVKINVLERADRKLLGTSLAAQCGAEIVQVIGKVWVLYVRNPDAEPRLSNVHRYA
jgi:RNA-binding protein